MIIIEVLLRDDEAEGVGQCRQVAACCRRNLLHLGDAHILSNRAEFLVDHMTTLAYRLRTASQDDLIMVQYAAYMIYECLPIAQNLDQKFKEALANDLLAILKGSGHLQALHVSVKCLCALFEHALSDDKMLRNVLQYFLKILSRTVDKLTADGKSFELPAQACRHCSSWVVYAGTTASMKMVISSRSSAHHV